MNRLSEKLGIIDLNKESHPIGITTNWCRIVADAPDSHNYNEQAHTFFELHLALSGDCEFMLGDVLCHLESGKYLLLPPGAKHKLTHASEDFTKLVWGFFLADHTLSDALAKGCNTVWPKETQAKIYTALNLLLSEADSPDGFQSLSLIKTYLNTILVFIIRELTDLRSEEKIVKASHAITDEMYRFISENLSARVGLKEASAWLYVSERHLQRLCLAEHSMSFGEIKRSIQYEKIRALLTDTDLPLSKIAADAGFADEYAMNKFFKRMSGTTPAKYRRWAKK